MSSPTHIIRVAGVHHDTLEFWAAEVPQGDDGAFTRHIGYDHPALALQVILGAANWQNPLAHALADLDLDTAWFAAHTDEHITAMTLVAVARATFHTDQWISRTVMRAGSVEQSNALTLALAPRALYRVTVRDPAWLTHLRTGQEFASTAHTPFPPVYREPVHQLTTPGAWQPITAIMHAPIDASRMHLYRNSLARGSWCHDHEEARVVPSNGVRELFLRHGAAMFVYFDATTPRFNPAKFPFVARKPLPAPVVKMRMAGAAAGPRGFHLCYDAPTRHTDGVTRVRFDHLYPDNKIAWLALEGEPRVQLGTLAAADITTCAVGLDQHLRDTAERIHLDLAREQ